MVSDVLVFVFGGIFGVVGGICLAGVFRGPFVVVLFTIAWVGYGINCCIYPDWGYDEYWIRQKTFGSIGRAER